MSSRHKHNDLPWYLKDFIENENIESTERNRDKNGNIIDLDCNEIIGSKGGCSSQEKYVCQDETNCFKNNEQNQEKKETMEASSAITVQDDIDIDVNSVFHVYNKRSHDANGKFSFEFKRFTGSIDELEKKSSRRNHLKPDEETRTMGLYTFRPFHIEWTPILLILLWVLFLSTPLLRSDVGCKKDSKVVVHDSDGEQSNNTNLSPYSSEEDNGHPESSENDRSNSKDSAETSYLEKALSSKIDNHIGNNKEEDDVTASKLAYCKSSKLIDQNVPQDASINVSNFGNHVELVAEAISKSCGLDRKDSLQIAVSQVLSDQRHKAQIEIDRTRAKVQKKKEEAQKVVADFKRLMISIMFGRILVLSVTLQLLLSNFNEIRILSIHYQSFDEIWSTLWGIVVEKICGCKSVENSSTALPYILLSILSTEQTMVAICIARLILQMTVVVITHKCMSIFHSQILHQIINLTVLMNLLLNTQVGFSIIRTIACMMVYNVINCVLTVANLVFLKLDHVKISPLMNIQSQDSDDKMIMEMLMGDYDLLVSNLSHLKTKLLAVVFLGSVLLLNSS